MWYRDLLGKYLFGAYNYQPLHYLKQYTGANLRKRKTASKYFPLTSGFSSVLRTEIALRVVCGCPTAVFHILTPMKTNHLYFNVLLTLLTACLIGIFIQNQVLIGELKRERISAEGYSSAGLGAYQISNRAPSYALVPVNADGSIDVRVVAGSETVNVNLHQVSGYPVADNKLPVKAEMVDVNIKKIDGQGIAVHDGQLPVKAERLDVNLESINGQGIHGGALPVTGR